MGPTNIADGQIAYDGIGVGGECRLPLRSVCGITPSRRERGDIAFAAFLKRYSACSSEPALIALGPLCINRVVSVLDLLPRPAGTITRFGKSEVTDWAKTHVPGPAINHVAEYPGLGCALDNTRHL